MIYDNERLDLERRFIRLEFRATIILLIRAIPSLIIWIGFLIWLYIN